MHTIGVICALWFALNGAVVVGCWWVACRRERRERRTVVAMVQAAERYANAQGSEARPPSLARLRQAR
jgi:hypothetical protein